MNSINKKGKYIVLIFLFVLVLIELLININISVVFCAEDLIRIGTKDLSPETVQEGLKLYARYKRIVLDFAPTLKKANKIGLFSHPDIREGLNPAGKILYDIFIDSLQNLLAFLEKNELTFEEFIDWLEETDQL